MQLKLNGMHRMLIPVLLMVAAGFITACGPENFSEDEIKTEQQPFNADVDIGGFVFYNTNGSTNSSGEAEFEPSEDAALSSVTITLTDIDGVAQTTTTNSSGIWELENVVPGNYFISLSLTGYETILDDFDVSIVDTQNVGNAFFNVGTVDMKETDLEVTILGNTLRNGDNLANLVGGISAVYAIATIYATDIAVTFSQTVVLGKLALDCTSLVGTGGVSGGKKNTSSSNVTTFSMVEADVDQCLDGSDADALADGMDSNGYTTATMTITADWITPIHGTFRSSSSTLKFEVTN